MNIAFVLPYLADRFGGPVAVVKNAGRTLTAMGHNVSYWATANKNDQEELASMDCAHIYDVVWPRSWHRSRDLARGLSAEITSVDILHISDMWLHPTYAASRIANANHTPYILRPAGGLQPWQLSQKRLKKKIYLALLARRALDKAQCLHAVTPYEAEHLRMAGYRAPITIIPNGVNMVENTKSPDGVEAENRWPVLKSRPVVLFMSRLSPEKGLDRLIPAWAQVIKRGNYSDALLVLAGPDDRGYHAVVEALVEQHALQSHVLFTGMVRGREKQALISRADLYTLPSHGEGFSMSILENLAAGKPVLITPGCHFPQVVEAKAGLCVPPEPGALAEALCEFLEMSQSERDAMGRRGVNLVKKNYTWDRIVEKLLTVYDCILSGKSIPLHPEPMELNAK